MLKGPGFTTFQTGRKPLSSQRIKSIFIKPNSLLVSESVVIIQSQVCRSQTGMIGGRRSQTGLIEGCRSQTGMIGGCRSQTGMIGGCRSQTGLIEGCRSQTGMIGGRRSQTGMIGGCSLRQG